MKILIIEDDVAFSSFLGTLLAREWGHQVTSAYTGREGLEELSKAHYDLVLVDIYLPNGLGHELIEPIKNRNGNASVITMTGYNDLELEKTVRAKGVDYYMIKPFEIEGLKAVIDHLVKKSGRA
jgi:two-component system response regulator CiaR